VTYTEEAEEFHHCFDVEFDMKCSQSENKDDGNAHIRIMTSVRDVWEKFHALSGRMAVVI
jgi:hypothetical protein